MGVSITSNYKDAIGLSGGYSTMHIIRTKIALAFDKELGECYSTLVQCYLSGNDDVVDEWKRKFNKILKNERFKTEDKDILNFLLASDCEGKISYKTCGKIYNLIKDIEAPNLRLRYSFYSNENDWKDFKTLLKECYSHRAYMVWY